MMNDVLDLCENGGGESNRKTKRFRKFQLVVSKLIKVRGFQ